MTPPSTAPAALFTGLTAGTVMHPGVLTAPDDAPARALAAIMAAHQVHAVVLGDGNRPRVVSALDLLAAVLADGPDARAAQSARGLPVVDPGQPLDGAVRAMASAGASHALVRAADAAAAIPSGVLSSFDVVAVFAGRDPRVAGMPRPAAARPALSESRLDRVTAREVMHAGVVGVAPDTSLRALAAILADHRAHCAAVSGLTTRPGGERLVWAIASDMDVLRCLAAGRAEATAAGAAATEPLTVNADDPLDAVASRLVRNGVSHAVVTEAAAPRGVVSALDLAAVVAIGAGPA